MDVILTDKKPVLIIEFLLAIPWIVLHIRLMKLVGNIGYLN